MMKFRHFTTALALAGLFAWAGCSDEGDDPMDPTGGTPGPVSFADDLQPVFNSNCVGCHGDGGNAGLDLRSGRSYANLVGNPATESGLARIEPGEPENSWLYLKITGQQTVGDQMPPGSPLNTDTTDRIRTWIEEGALDN